MYYVEKMGPECGNCLYVLVDNLDNTYTVIDRYVPIEYGFSGCYIGYTFSKSGMDGTIIFESSDREEAIARAAMEVL